MYIESIVTPKKTYNLNKVVNFIYSDCPIAFTQNLKSVLNNFAYRLGHRKYAKKFNLEVKGSFTFNFDYKDSIYPLSVVNDKANSRQFAKMTKSITQERETNITRQYPLFRAYLPSQLISYSTSAYYSHLAHSIATSGLYCGLGVYINSIDIPITEYDCCRSLISMRNYEYAEFIEDGKSLNIIDTLQEWLRTIFPDRYSCCKVDIRNYKVYIDAEEEKGNKLQPKYSDEEQYFILSLIDILMRAFVLTEPKYRDISTITGIEGIILLYHDQEKFLGNYETIFNDAYINLFVNNIPKYFPNLQIIIQNSTNEDQ